MSKEFSRVREGENPRSDQIRRETSSNNDQIHDILQHPDQFHHQQRPKPEQQKGKEIMTPEREMQNIQEIIGQRDGKTSVSDINQDHLEEALAMVQGGAGFGLGSLKDEIRLKLWRGQAKTDDANGCDTGTRICSSEACYQKFGV
jgi:hypothetical protein